MSAPLVVSIGMTHPQNIAGLGLDARVAAEYGVRHAMVVAAISAQDDRGVHGVFPLAPEVVRAQLRAVPMQDASAVRVGALGSAALFDELERSVAGKQVVLDPVFASSAGGSLYADDPLPRLRSFPRDAAYVVTPNLDEARAIAGMQIAGPAEMIRAGEQIVRSGASAALVKGGHLPGEPVDVLVTSRGAETFAAERIAKRMRGTGCMLAMALACELALGRDLADAVRGARTYVRANIARS